MQQKGQGSLEYLLIIGGGILVAVVIIGAIVSLAGTGTGGTKANVANQTCHTYLASSDCNTADIDIITGYGTACNTPVNKDECCWNGTKIVGERCSVNSTAVYK